MAACIDQLDRWGVVTQNADGEIAGAWRLRSARTVAARQGAVRPLGVRPRRPHGGGLPGQGRGPAFRLMSPPSTGCAALRSVGINGCRFSAALGDQVIGYIEVETLDTGERLAQARRLGRRRQPAGARRVPAARRRYLAARAGRRLAAPGQRRPAARLRLAGREPILAESATRTTGRSCRGSGFRELTRTKRGWNRRLGRS